MKQNKENLIVSNVNRSADLYRNVRAECYRSLTINDLTWGQRLHDFHRFQSQDFLFQFFFAVVIFWTFFSKASQW